MQLSLARGRRLLLRVQRAVVDRFDFGRDPHDCIAARHDLPAQKTVSIDFGRAVEERRIRVPVLVELAPQLAILFRIGFAQQRFQLADHLFAFEMVGDQPRAVFGGRGRRVEQIIARQYAGEMQIRTHAPQARFNIAIASVQAVEVRVCRVCLPLRGQNRYHYQRQEPQQREGHDRPRPKTHPADSRQMMFGH